MRKQIASLLTGIFLAISAPGPAAAQPIPSPEEFLGFKVGADRRLARWDSIVEYLSLVAQRSDRVRVETAGRTTLDNPYIVVILSSPANMTRLQHYRDIARRLADGRNLSAEEARRLAREGKAIVFITHNMHSTEIASSQASLELVYQLAVDDSEEAREIIDNVILVHVPSANPDGQIMVTDWYRKNLGTPYERSRMPWLYHVYAGHDNNRDLFMGNMVESRHLMKLLYRDWFPQVYLDQHQMGSYGARMFVPPFPDPANERIHPLMWPQTAFLGGGMAAELQAAGKQGVLTNAMYRIYHPGGGLAVWWHNIVGLLTETASVAVATPMTIRREQLQPTRPDGGLPEYKMAKNFPDPWWGGEWRLRDIVDYQLIAARSVLKQSARYRSEFLFNQYLMAAAAANGESEGPAAYVVSQDQRDPITAADMVQRLLNQGVEVHQARAAFDAGGKTYPAGSYVIMTHQAKRPILVDLMETQHYPDVRLYPGGPPIRPFDDTGYTLSLMMDVDTARIERAFEAPLEPVQAAGPPAPAPFSRAENVYVLNHEINRTAVAVNRLLKKAIPVYRLSAPVSFQGKEISPGAFAVPASAPEAFAALQAISRELSLPVAVDPENLPPSARGGAAAPGIPLSAPRIGLYKSWLASMDEGWTRWILEQFEFPYTSLLDTVVRAGALHERLDVIILPADLTLDGLIKGNDPKEMPAEFAGGIGEAGVENLKQFVRDGGTLLTLDGGDAVVLKMFGVAVEDTLGNLKEEEFFCPGTILRLGVDTNHPIGYGMPKEVPAKFVRSRAYQVVKGTRSAEGHVRVLAAYPGEGPLLMSGLLIGEKHLAGRAAAVEVPYDRGRIVMLGFRVQHRGQTHGTYKLLLNTLYYSALGGEKPR